MNSVLPRAGRPICPEGFARCKGQGDMEKTQFQTSKEDRWNTSAALLKDVEIEVKGRFKHVENLASLSKLLSCDHLDNTSSIARPLMRQREETVRATDRISDIRWLVPLQYALATDTSPPRTSALPLTRGREYRDQLSAHLQ